MDIGQEGGQPSARPRFDAEMLYEAARLYYEEGKTQAEVAVALSVSRPTVSRLLAEARDVGIVEIKVHRPLGVAVDHLAERVRAQLGLRRVRLTRSEAATGAVLATEVGALLREARLEAGEPLLVSSGVTLYGCIQGDLPSLPGVIVAPTVGGQEEPEPWYQTNVLTTTLAAKVGGVPLYLHAPALPSAALYESIIEEPSVQRVMSAWNRSRIALLGLGTALANRASAPAFVPKRSASLKRAVGDICSRFYDAEGRPVSFAGSDRLVALPLERLTTMEFAVGVAAGPSKVTSIRAAARAGYINTLVTDVATAEAILR